MAEPMTHFGKHTIPVTEKTEKVAEVFHKSAPKYDLMNHIMSLGLHLGWKRFAVNHGYFSPGQTILDLASGSGDLTSRLAKKVGTQGRVIACDYNYDMLTLGRARLEDQGILKPVHYTQADGHHLPFLSHTFDGATLAFGLRNMTSPQAVLEELKRVLKPGAILLVLEFSHTPHPLVNQLYQGYAKHLIPRFGKWIADNQESYEYLVESIERHPDPHTLAQWFEQAGFHQVKYTRLAFGLVALHEGLA